MVKRSSIVGSPGMRGRKTGILAGLPAVWFSLLLVGCGEGKRDRAGLPTAGARAVKVRRGPFDIAHEETGEIRAVRAATVSTLLGGKIAELFEEGKPAKKGQVLLKIEGEELEQEAERCAEALALAEKQLADAEEKLRTELPRLKDEEDAEKERVQLAELTLQTLRQKPTELERREAAAQLAAAQAELAAAQQRLQTVELLFQGQDAAPAELENAQLERQLAEKRREKAQIAHDQALAGAAPHQIKRAEIELELAQANLALKQIDLEAQRRRFRQKLESAKISLERHRDWKHQIARKLQLLQVLAPYDGIVHYRNLGRRWAQKVAVGDQLWSGMGVIDLPEPGWVKVRTQLPESVVLQVVPGPPVEDEQGRLLTFEAWKSRAEAAWEAHPSTAAAATAAKSPTVCQVMLETRRERRYRGVVVWIDQWARDRHDDPQLSYEERKQLGDSGVRVFSAEVALLESGTDELQLGYKARVRFILRRFPQAVTVEKDAVRRQGNQAFVRLRERGDQIIRREVVTGEESDGLVVIREGLSGGETVLSD